MTAPLILSTWSFGRAANNAAWPYLVDHSKSSLDAVEQACRHCEADPKNMTVGYGAYPDRGGQISLDASIMLSPAWCGAVAYVRRFMHPITIARLVMEHTEHVMLAGEGAEQFALRHGLEPSELLSDASREAWQKWIDEHGGVAHANIEESAVDDDNHDTIGALALDCTGVLAGACSTSGLAWKLPGRVGDSPGIGQGLYVHPKYGAAVATGTGELTMGICATHLAVESMRQGATPQQAVEAVVQCAIDNYELRENHQVGIIALSPGGQWGSAALRGGFRVAVRSEVRDELVEPGRVFIPA
jgi:N4-(beta-N-acetylglucosaminyl)-L-asparaginase